MKTLKFNTVLLMLTLLVSFYTVNAKPLTENEKAGLQLMREEEKLHTMFTQYFSRNGN